MNGDSIMERVSIVREDDEMIVRLHRIPDLETLGEWRIPGHSVEVATTRCKGRIDGDLWLHVGVAHDPRGERWTHSLYHLEKGELVVKASGIRQSALSLDVDGDGCVDPIVADDGGGGRVLLKGVWKRLPSEVSPMALSGLAFGNGQVEATDLDGDGDLDLLMTSSSTVSVVDVGNGYKVAPLTRQPARGAQVTMWSGRQVVVAVFGKVLKILSTDGQRRELARVAAESFTNLVPDIDPTGGGDVLAFDMLTTHLLDASAPSKLVDLGVILGGFLDRSQPKLGPVSISTDDSRELLGVRMTQAGHPMLAFPGSVASYELVLLRAPWKKAARVIRSAEVNGDLRVEPGLVDLEHDGTYEIVLTETAGFSSCDERSSGSTATLYLLDGDGTVLWQDEERSEYYDGGWQPSQHAHARAMDLWGDGRFAVRVRAPGLEWYLVPDGAVVPEHIPPCLE